MDEVAIVADKLLDKGKIWEEEYVFLAQEFESGKVVVERERFEEVRQTGPATSPIMCFHLRVTRSVQRLTVASSRDSEPIVIILPAVFVFLL
jgi:hypothetical protein